MALGSLIEPLVVVTLLFGGTWVNRNNATTISRPSYARRSRSHDSIESGYSSPAGTEDGLLSPGRRSSSDSLLPAQEAKYRTRQLRVFGWRREVRSPNTRVHKDRLMSRVLHKFPFLVEAWYWALIYWVYQIGRAITALTLDSSTVDVARHHALQVIHLEQTLHLFFELPIQKWFLARPLLMLWTNRIYSFIHIPGTILFLVVLFYYTTTSNRIDLPNPSTQPSARISGSPAGPLLYEARRRTMATCNLIAFIIFTLWPCMPPRLLSDPNATGPEAKEGRQYGFVDTVHGEDGEASVWTQNRFCNQYAAMPSLHFGYSLLIGLTVMTIPLSLQHQRSRLCSFSACGSRVSRRVPSLARVACVLIGAAYPTIILLAIISTANHFVLDAVAGAMVCGVAWGGNGILLNLVPVEDYFLSVLRIHKPEKRIGEMVEGEVDGVVVLGKGVEVE